MSTQKLLNALQQQNKKAFILNIQDKITIKSAENKTLMHWNDYWNIFPPPGYQKTVKV